MTIRAASHALYIETGILMKNIIYRIYLYMRYTIISTLWPYILHNVTTTLIRLKIIKGRQAICLSDTNNIKNILIIGPDALGDCVLFSSAMKHIRKKFQKQKITILSRSVPKNYLQACPYIDRVLIYDQKQLTIATVIKDIKFFSFLRKKHFDLVINALWTPTEISGFLTYTTGAPLRIGCIYPHPLLTRMRTGLLFTHCYEIQEEKHVVEYFMDLLHCLDIYPNLAELQPEVWSTSVDSDFAASVAENSLSLSNAKYLVAIAPGAGSPLREWPTKYYAVVADYCINHNQAAVVILGGPGDVELAIEIEEAMVGTPYNLVGKATFAQTGEVLKRCHLFLGNDSGPMHLAAAAGIPIIALFSSGNFVHYAPYGNGHQIVRHDLPCYPCYERCVFYEPVCLTSIRPDEILPHIRDILDAASNSFSMHATTELKSSEIS